MPGAEIHSVDSQAVYNRLKMQSFYAIVTMNFYSYHMMKKVILFLCQGLEEHESNVFTDIFGWTTTYGLELIQLVTIGLRQKVNRFHYESSL